MAAADSNAQPSSAEVEHFELMRPVQWDRWSWSGLGQLGALIALSLGVEPNWLLRVEHDTYWRNYYAPLLAQADERRAFLIELAIQRNPRYVGLEPHLVPFESDDRTPYVREMAKRFELPPQMTDAQPGHGVTLPVSYALGQQAMPRNKSETDEQRTAPASGSDTLANALPPPKPATDDDRVVRHKTKTHRDVLTPLIDRSMRSADGPDDYHSGWTRFVAFAQDKVSPLLGYVLEDKKEYVKYLDGGQVKFLTKDAFRKRVKPSAR
ncbi:hypothetical protein [Paraburkholderia sp. JHI869]|uniref:hypothetical protein n=1 Tax=Paraburkholderia sp. JHI869 TaxID=3112959 RepID=UPI003178308D